MARGDPSPLADLGVLAAAAPLRLCWPSARSPVDWLEFDHAADWARFVERLRPPPGLPEAVERKFLRAQGLYRLGWIDRDLIKAGELAALIALELAVRDRYGRLTGRKKPAFADLLTYMVDGDGLTDAALPVVARCGGSVVGQVTGDISPRLSDIRNGMAHGDPFEGPPIGGLLEVVRDLIAYAYRDYLAERASAALPGSAPDRSLPT
ncbi:hypothetical protein RSD66_08735 [Brevundimonas sp. S1H14]|uniref:hypothetical protein n=1 Tax=Brevundimonas sp. S1H14 TaxID=3078084 RepID=UPI0039EB96A8